MPQPSLSDITTVLHEIIVPFSQLERDMPLPVPSYRNENDAEHSWSLAFLGFILAPQIDPSLDIGLVSIYATVHDVVEIYAGDTSLWGSSEELSSKQEREEEAVGIIKEKFPAFPQLSHYIEEYETKSNNEARFVYALDKFINLLIRSTDEGRYFKARNITIEMFKQKIIDHQHKAHSHPGVARYYDELLQSFFERPDYFYKEAA